jgi:hypothetical protein
MTEFMWGALSGAVSAPFAYIGAKWCLSKFKSLLKKNEG